MAKSDSIARSFLNNLGRLFFFAFMMAIFAAFALFAAVTHYSKDLPSTEKLADYQPKTMTRLYDAKGNLLSEYASERRIFTPIERIPTRIKNAFIAAEDQNFYTHSGVDYISIVRASIRNLAAKATGRGSVSGASTITQQVVKNLLLTNEKTISRKIKEAILATRLTKAMSKDRILEIYLNEIFLGNQAYGVGAAANNYFGKNIEDLSVEEAALLAAMPKAPSRFNPYKNYKRAKERRDWVIERMYEESFISVDEMKKAQQNKISLVPVEREAEAKDFFSEEVRRILVKKLGAEKVYGGGLFVRTTVDPALQEFAEQAMFEGMRAYDHKHGWRGPIAQIGDLDIWREALSEIAAPEGLGRWQLAVVLSVRADKAEIGLLDGDKSFVPFSTMKWASKVLPDQRYGASPNSAKQVVSVGDVIAVSAVLNEKADKIEHYALEQIPNVNGAFMAMDPQSGRVLAMVGGYPYGGSHFNRATQALRQPGSAFKPFVYLTALENGFSPSSVIEDGPLAINMGAGTGIWRPKNYSNDFLGFITLRKGLEKSRNNMTILLTLMLGINKVQDVAKRLGIYADPIPYYPMALGAQETTLEKMMTAYSTLANSGKKVLPRYIDKVQNNFGETIYRNDLGECLGCDADSETTIPTIESKTEQVVDPVIAFQVTSMLEGVVQRGTAVRAKSLGKPIAGKTGTTNESFDTWFIGYSPDIVAGAYIGFDKPRTLGAKETGASVTLPIFIKFMEKALADTPAKPFKVPEGVAYTAVDTTTGKTPTEASLPQNIQYEIVNPNAKPIEYSTEYKRQFGYGETYGAAPFSPEDEGVKKENIDSGGFFEGVY